MASPTRFATRRHDSWTRAAGVTGVAPHDPPQSANVEPLPPPMQAPCPNMSRPLWPSGCRSWTLNPAEGTFRGTVHQTRQRRRTFCGALADLWRDPHSYPGKCAYNSTLRGTEHPTRTSSSNAYEKGDVLVRVPRSLPRCVASREKSRCTPGRRPAWFAGVGPRSSQGSGTSEVDAPAFATRGLRSGSYLDCLPVHDALARYSGTASSGRRAIPPPAHHDLSDLAKPRHGLWISSGQRLQINIALAILWEDGPTT